MIKSAALLILSFWGLDAIAQDVPPANPRISPDDSVAAWAIAHDSTIVFLGEWRTLWRADWSKFNQRSVVFGPRISHAHCHLPGTTYDKRYEIRKDFPVIWARNTSATTCPSWTLGALPTPDDAAESIDNALLPATRVAAKAARARLLQTLEAAAKLSPADIWIIGQRVRFHVDQGETSAALKVAGSCRNNEWWCGVLSGYVLHKEGKRQRADSAFVAAELLMPAEVRCGWKDLRALVPLADRAEYMEDSCLTRDTLYANYWWLADPLHSEPGNERLTEHRARQVLVLMHSAFPEDEYYQWSARRGGEVVEEMIVRYGWPTAAVWMGSAEDKEHDENRNGLLAPSGAPYTTAEYSEDRAHFAAAWSRVESPFSALEGDWELGAPPRPRGASSDGPANIWWPAEHMKIGAAFIVQLPAGQTAFFRRQNRIEVATAINAITEREPMLMPLLGQQVSRAFVASRSTRSFEVIARDSLQFSNRLLMTASVNPAPAVFSIELSAPAERVTLRSRFGASPPPPLDSLRRGAVALSDPVFYEADSTEAPASASAMLPRMLGGTSVPGGSKIGVFWETYGLAVGDTMQFAMSVTAASANRGLVRRMATALKLITAAPGGIAVSWEDYHRDGTGALTGSPSILPRSLTLDLAQLPKGVYSVEVTVTARGQPPVRAARTLTIN